MENIYYGYLRMEKVIKKTKLLTLLFCMLAFGQNIIAQCPTAPATCDFTVTSATNQTSSFTVGAGQTLCISSGTYTGFVNSVNSTGKIYVASGATFNPSGISNFGGAIINCGTAILPGFDFNNNANLARIENYGVMTLAGPYNFNAASTWINGLNSKMTFNSGMIMIKVNMINNGNMVFNSSFTMNGNANVFVNHDSLTANGSIILEGSIDNDGYVFAKGSNLTLNAAGNIINKCYFKSDGSFTYNGSDTLFITGLTWVTGKNSGGFNVQGTAVNVSSTGWIQGVDFLNNASVIGSGNLLFTGNTTNQGAFGNDAKGLNFFDSGIPAGGRFFDLQNVNPNATVTKNPISPRDSTYVPGTCSALIRCNVGGTGAGNDTTVCGSNIDLKDARTGNPYLEAWTTVAGNPAAANINSSTGVVTGMTVAGEYYFRLYKTTNANCNDVVKVTVVTTPVSTLNVLGSTVCRTSNNATVQIVNAEIGVKYDAYLGTTFLGTGTGTGSNLTINIPVSILVDGSNNISFTAIRTTCTTVPLTNVAIVNVSPNQSASATVTATSPICTGQKSTITLAATKGVNYKVYDQNNILLADTTAIATGNISFTTTPLSATIVPVSYTLTIKANVVACSEVILTTKPIVVVNPSQNAGAQVLASSPICSGSRSTVSITPTQGILYSIYDQNGRLLGDSVAQSSATLNIVTAPLTATSGPQSYTLRISAKVAGCDSILLTTRPSILVNPFQPPNANISAISPICSGSSTTVTIAATRGVTYTVFQNNTSIGSGTANTTGNFLIQTLPLTSTTNTTSYSLRVVATIAGCDSVELTARAIVVVNRRPSQIAVNDTTVCSNTTSTSLRLTGVENNVRYQAFFGTSPIGSPIVGPASVITFNPSILSVGNNKISISGSISGCTPSIMSDTAIVKVNKLPVDTAFSATTPICQGTLTTVSLKTPKTGVTYIITDTYNSTTRDLSPALNASGIGNYGLVGVGLHTLRIKAEILGCQTVNFTSFANVQVNAGIDSVVLSGVPDSSICQKSNSVTIRISNPTVNVDYNIFKQEGTVETKVNLTPLTSLSPSYTIPNIPFGTNTYVVKATIGGCGTSNVKSFTINVDKEVDSLSAKINAGLANVCQGTSDLINVSISGTQNGVTYVLKNNGVAVDTVRSTADNETLRFNSIQLNRGLNIFTATGSNNGCGTINLATKDSVFVNDTVSTKSPKLIFDKLIVCQGSTDTVNIKLAPTQIGVSYFIRLKGKDVGDTITALKNNDTLTFENIKLDISNNAFTVFAFNNGCATVQLDTKGSVKVSDSLDLSNPVIDGSPFNACEGTDNVEVTMITTQKDASYIIYDNGSAIGDTLKSTKAGDLLQFGKFTLSVGMHYFTSYAYNDGCAAEKLLAKDSVKVSKKIDPNSAKLKSGLDEICETGDALLTLSKTQIGVTYNIYEKGLKLGSKKSIADSSDLTFGAFKLTPGLHVFTIDAFNDACTDTIFTTDSLKVNGAPVADFLVLSPNKWILCSNDTLKIKVYKVKTSDYKYKLIDNYNGVYNLLSNEVSGNKDTLRFGPFKGFSPGKHKISVVESVFGCDPDTSNFIEITINNALDTRTPQIDASKGVLCTDGSISFTVSKTAKGDEYRLYDGSQLLITRTSTADLEVLRYGPLFNLSPGLHTFYGTITNPGCGTFPMVDTVNVLVNAPPDENTKVTSNSPICINQAVTFTVQKADSVLYSLYSVKPLKLVAGPDSSTLKTKVYTVAQKDSFYVAANIAGCATVWLNPMQKITVNEFPTESLKVTDFTACGDDSAIVKLSTPSTTNAYIATLGAESVSQNGPGVLTYKFATNNLISDSNNVNFRIFVPGCDYKTITNGTIYKILPHSGTSSAAVCENDTMTLSVPKIKGVDSSVWVVPNGVKTISLDNDTATFKWGLKNTEGKIIVYPVGSLGRCSLYSDTINVTVFEKTKGTADYIQVDTLCVGAIDTISLVDLLGVIKDSLIPANGVTILEVITNTTEFNKYVVQYNVAKSYVHQYLVLCPCGTDTIYKTTQVVVLPNPVADAGMYPVYDMLYFPREVVLDGSNSTKGNFIYSWKTIPAGNISNSTNAVASFVPEQSSTVVELKVTNLNGMCSNADTAIVNVSLGIFIPNVFTPNNDGDHDQWLLENVQSFYPNVSVDIYSKWGTHVFHSKGYSKPWDGKRNGEDLPSATYYYVIDLKKPNFKPVAGSVTILR